MSPLARPFRLSAALALVLASALAAPARAQNSPDEAMGELAESLFDHFQRLRNTVDLVDPVVSVDEVKLDRYDIPCQPLSDRLEDPLMERFDERSRLVNNLISFEQRQSVDDGARIVRLDFARDGDRLDVKAIAYEQTATGADREFTSRTQIPIDRLDADAALCVTPDERFPGRVLCESLYTLAIVEGPSGGREVTRLNPGTRFEVEQSYAGRTAFLIRLSEGDIPNAASRIGFVRVGLRDLHDERQFSCTGLPPLRDERALERGTVFSDGCPGCPELVVVPGGGRSWFGSDLGEVGRGDDEEDLHAGYVDDAFALGRGEVSVDEWRACVEAGRCAPRAGPGGDGRMPVAVSLRDAEAYLAWLSEETGERYRLPGEREWEHAARAYAKTRYAWGDVLTDRGLAVCRNCGGRDARPEPATAGSPNEFGLIHMHGNLWEWVRADCGSGTRCPEHLLKGGSYLDDAIAMRAGNRHTAPPDVVDPSVGFRVLREIGR